MATPSLSSIPPARTIQIYLFGKRPVSEWELHCWGNTTNGAFSFTSVESEEELINNTGCYTVRRNELVIQAIKAGVVNKARPLLPGECMSLKGQQLGINCDCDSAEWQQLCNISGGRAGAGRGRHRESEGGREGGRNWSEQCWVSGSPSNLRHLRAAWNMEAWAWAVVPNAGPRTDKGDKQGWPRLFRPRTRDQSGNLGQTPQIWQSQCLHIYLWIVQILLAYNNIKESKETRPPNRQQCETKILQEMASLNAPVAISACRSFPCLDSPSAGDTCEEN